MTEIQFRTPNNSILCRRQYNLGKQFPPKKKFRLFKLRQICRRSTDQHDVKTEKDQSLDSNSNSNSNSSQNQNMDYNINQKKVQNLGDQIQEQEQLTIQQNLEILRQLGYNTTTISVSYRSDYIQENDEEQQQQEQQQFQRGKPIIEEFISESKTQNLNLQKITIEKILQIFPYTLDKFQKITIEQIISGNSVVACAPTGAGKTSIAIGAALQTILQKKRIIYTTPLKALSNQKFTEFKQFFGEFRVGLQTGDIVYNSNAQIVVMTTEIFRNQLYRNDSEAYMGVVQKVGDVGLVVLDEVHYLGDVDRGTVWEEVIINCPKEIQILAMSATVQNPHELGEWINQVHGNCTTIRTKVRPVPLKFWYGFSKVVYQQSPTSKPRKKNPNTPATPLLDVIENTLQIVPLLDEQEKNLNPILQDRQLETESMENPEKDFEQEAIQQLSKMKEPKMAEFIYELQQREMLPAIYFLFSRASCDREAIALYERKLKFVDEEEFRIIYEEICKLKQENPDSVREQMIDPMCAGIASHHAGCLPGWKNLTEQLFQRGLIKIVFATETLAAGINMPARTTIISQLARFRDTEIQRLSNNELLQMPGRAGRRGFDTEGDCIIPLARHSSPKTAIKLLMREPEALESQFTAGYGMVLNILNSRSMEQAKMFVEKSFLNYLVENGGWSGRSGVRRKVANLEGEIEEMEEQVKQMEMPVQEELEEKQKSILQKNHKAARMEFAELIKKFNEDRGIIAQDAIQYYEVPFTVQIETRKGGDEAIKKNQTSAICIKIISQEEILQYERPPNQPRNILDLLQINPKDYLLCLDTTNKLYVVAPGCLCGIGNECQIDEKQQKQFYQQILELGKNNWKEMKGQMDGYFADGLAGMSQISFSIRKQEKFEEINLEQERVDELEAMGVRMEELRKKQAELRKRPQKQNQRGIKPNKMDKKYEQLLELIYNKKAQLQQVTKQSQNKQQDPSSENWLEFTSVVSVLQNLNALTEDFKPTNLGLIARDIRGDHELFLAAVLTQPQLTKLSPPQLASVLGALMAGPMLQYKQDISCMYDTSEIVMETVKNLTELQEEIFEVQELFQVDRPILVDGRMCGIFEAWASGQSWEMVKEGCNLDEGDVARLLMRTIDFLKQVIHVEQVWEGIRQNCKLALKEMDRAPVSEIYI